MIASAARWVPPQPFPDYLALDAYADRPACRLTSVARARAGCPSWARAATRRRPPPRSSVVLVLALSGRGAVARCRCRRRRPASLADPVPYDGRTPDQPPGDEQRVLVQMPRPALGELAERAGDGRGGAAALRRVAQAEARDDALGAGGPRHLLQRRRVLRARVERVRRDGLARSDVAQLNTPGTQVRAVRRLYPADERAGARARHGAAAPRRRPASRPWPCWTPA